MSYVLKRPMFRLGGPSADGVGITSGFNRRNYSNGKYGEQIEETIEKINNVTKSSIEKVANKILSSKPTIASIGPIKQLETLDKIQKRLN